MSKAPEFPLLTTPLFYVVQVIAWLLSFALTLITLGFVLYQLFALYIPYLHSKIMRSPHRFPEYFYRVYGDDVTDLCNEHYGYLISAILVSVLSVKLVLPDHPFKAQQRSDFTNSIFKFMNAVSFRLGKVTGFGAVEDPKLD